jgi:hypothetical protein
MGSDSSDEEEASFNGEKEDRLERGHGRASRARGHEDAGYYSKSPTQSDMDDEEVLGDCQRRTTSRGRSQMKRKEPPTNVAHRRVLNNARLARKSEQARKSRCVGKSVPASTRRQGGGVDWRSRSISCYGGHRNTDACGGR